MLLAAASLAVVPGLDAANVLTNPSFENDPSGESQNILAWTWYGQSWGNTFNETDAGTAHAGSNYFKVFQGFTGSVNYNGIYQDTISGPGATYSAGGWAYTLSSDSIAGQNQAWLEISFRDASANVLALYRSAVMGTNAIAHGGLPRNSWIYLPVTNQYNPASFVVTNTTTKLVAPPGTSFVRYQVTFQGDANNSGGSMYFDDLVLDRVSEGPYGNWNIVWSDEFNGTSVDPKVWTYDLGNGSGGWGNNELEYYTSRPQNVSVSGGLLHITARHEDYNGYHYTSARLKTQGLFSRTYGRFEFRAKLPEGVGFWPALWLLGTNISSVGWPACGEVDVVESKGSNPSVVAGSLHWGGDTTKSYTLPGGTVTDFHNYVFEWTPTAMNWFVDGLLYQNQTNKPSLPFNHPFFLILNLAIGGNYLGNPSTNTINAGSTFPNEMQLDYLRIYEETAPLQISITRTNTSAWLSWPSNVVARLQRQLAPFASGSANWADVSNASNPFGVQTTSGGQIFRIISP